MRRLIWADRRRSSIVCRTLAALAAAVVYLVTAVPAAHASEERPELLYYNITSGAGAIGLINQSNEHVMLRGYPAGSFTAGWSHITSSGGRLLFYNANTGAGAIGVIDSNNQHVTLRGYPAGSFAIRWSHIV